ncbi:MAG: phosphatidylserine decarboxylase, partial [Clostridia bacterium]|nr:phosphatidylserine decarboxylase [Clostridia bacterium]
MREFTDLSNLKPSRSLEFLYRNRFGRGLLKILITKPISVVVGAFLSTPLSKPMIKSFVKKNNIDMSQFEKNSFSCYNKFFIRKIKAEKRPICFDKNALISPADSRLLAYKIDKNLNFKIKNSYYSLETLLDDNALAKEFEGGYLLIFRLCVDDYHRYCYFDDGKILSNKYIKSKLHTVQPIALENDDYFKENSREITVLNTKNFGKAIYVEIGAMMVGKIVNHKYKGNFKKGEEKGYFKFGGSTVAVVLKHAEIDEEILINSTK